MIIVLEVVARSLHIIVSAWVSYDTGWVDFKIKNTSIHVQEKQLRICHQEQAIYLNALLRAVNCLHRKQKKEDAECSDNTK